MARKRRVFEEGHGRKLMVIVDESPEVELALFYAAGRVLHAGGSILLLYVIEPENQFWEGVRQVQLEEETNKARAIFRLLRLRVRAHWCRPWPLARTPASSQFPSPSYRENCCWRTSRRWLEQNIPLKLAF
jgi:nucleotide-binding universal stress UspA family protein